MNKHLTKELLQYTLHITDTYPVNIYIYIYPPKTQTHAFLISL